MPRDAFVMNDRRTPKFFTDLAAFCALDRLPTPTAGALGAAADRMFRLPESLLDRIRPGDADDPILLQFLPRVEETVPRDGFSADPLQELVDSDDSARSPILRKYFGRALLLTGGTCAGNCRFCFRRHFSGDSGLFNSGDANLSAAENVENGENAENTLRTEEERLAASLAPLAADSTVRELILSGSDPLGLDDRRFGLLLDYIKKLPSVNRVRIHTRFPVLVPERVSERFLSQFHSIPGKQTQKYIFVFHINHPAEVSPAVGAMFSRLSGIGAILLVQSVLLAGVNDDAETLAELYEKLAACAVLPYYLHQLDRVAGAAHFEVPEARGLEIIRRLRETLPGYLVPRYVREIPGRPAKEPII